MEQLAGEYRETRAAIEALGAQRQIVTDAHAELRQSQADLARALDQAAGVRQELDQLHGQASSLANDQACSQQDREPGVGEHRRRHAHGAGSRIEDRISGDARTSSRRRPRSGSSL